MRVLISDYDISNIHLVRQSIGRIKKDSEVIYIDKSEDIISYMRRNRVDLLVIDMFTFDNSISELLQIIRAEGLIDLNDIILTFEFNLNLLINRFKKFNGVNLSIKPLHINNIMNKVENYSNNTVARVDIKGFLLKLGLKPNLKGFTYISKCINELINGEVESVKKLYRKIAMNVNSTSTRVEAAIRRSIKSIDFNNLEKDKRKYFSSEQTNSQFLYGIREFLSESNY